MFIAYLWMIASAAQWFIVKGLMGHIYFVENFLKTTREKNNILQLGCIFLFEMFISYLKIILVSLPALAMGLGGICIMDKVLRKWRIMVSLDVYIDIIMPLKFLISYINIMIL